MKPLGQPIAVGRTAEIFAWEDGQVLKLFRDWCSHEQVEYEVRVTAAAIRAGAAAPAIIGDILEINGRMGIVYERVDGPSLLEAMRRNPLKIPSLGRILAEVQLTMHRCTVSGLPGQTDVLTYNIENAPDLPDSLRKKALSALADLPTGDTLCHGDFHPDNVIITSHGPVVIDWTNAMQGHPAADVARTRLLISLGDPPPEMKMRWLILLGRNWFFENYLSCYKKASPEVMRQSDAFLPVLAAARLNERIEPEREKLLKLIKWS